MSPAAPLADPAGGRASARDTAVMIVDDQATFRTVARAVVEGTPGFELVAEAASGSEALVHANELEPELVLMDVRMPGMDGIETTRAMSTSHPDTVIVLVSLDELVDVELAVANSGAAAFLRKQDLAPRALRGLWMIHGRR